MIISDADLRAASTAARDALGQYMHRATIGPGVMLSADEDTGRMPPWAAWFARFAGGAIPQRFAASVPDGYGSWLMRMSAGGAAFVPTIAVNSRQIRAWAKSQKSGDRQYCENTITSRCIFHEVGHIRLHGHLLNAPGAPGLAPTSSPKEEEQAWVFAFLVLGMIVGDYAESRRVAAGQDDSPSKLV